MGRRAARRCDESRTESQQELPPVHRQPYQSSTAVFGPFFRPTEGTEDTEKASTRRLGETEFDLHCSVQGRCRPGHRPGRAIDRQPAATSRLCVHTRLVATGCRSIARRASAAASAAPLVSRTGVQSVRPPFLRVSVFEAFSVPSVPSVADPFPLSPPELAHAIISVCPSQ